MSFELNENYQPIRRYIYENGKDDVQGYVEYAEVDDPQYFSFEKKGWHSYIKDQVGTITKIYKHETKQMVNTKTYDIFGNMINQTGSSSGNLGFQSKYYDQESGLNYYYHRYYYPTIGRFINEDPIGFGGDFNFFRFCHNNPINAIDPFGLVTGSVGTIMHPMNPKEWGNWSPYPSRGGVTIPRWNSSYECKCIDGTWYLRFQINMQIHVYWNTKNSKYYHEMRHCKDMKKAYSKLIESGTIIEEWKGFPDFNSCDEAGRNAMSKIDNEIWSAIRWSKFKRDSYIAAFESLY
jgi:RHS repeat-associated protein